MINPVKVDKFLQQRKRLGFKKKLRYLDIFAIQVNSDYNKLTWKNVANMKAEKYRQFISPYWYMINPFSIFINVYDVIITILYIQYILFLPIRMSYIKFNKGSSIAIYQMIVDLCFCSCIPINFCLGIYDPLHKTVNYNPRAIVKHYLKGYFFVDVLACLPFEGVVFFANHYAYVSPPIEFYVVYICSYIRLLRFGSVLYMLRKTLFFMHVRGIFADIFCICFIWFTISYLMLSALYISPMFEHENRELLTGEPMAVLLVLHNTTGFLFTLIERLPTIPFGSSGEDLGPLSILFVAILVEPFFGAILIALYWSLKDSDIMYRAVLDEVNAYTLSLSAPDHTKKKIRDYFKMYHNQSLLLDDRKSLDFFTCHNQMKILKYTMDNIAMKVELFRDLPPRIRVAMVKELKREVLFTGYYVTTAGQIGTKMFIVSSGKLTLLSENLMKMSDLHQGSSLGEYQLLADSPHLFTAVCAEISVVYTLSRKSFNSVLLHLTDIYIDLREKITERHMNLVLTLDKIKRITTN